MSKILRKFGIIQHRTEKETSNSFTRTKYRINPYNPLSYIAILLTIIVGFVMFGVVGFWKEVVLRNPFKWH